MYKKKDVKKEEKKEQPKVVIAEVSSEVITPKKYVGSQKKETYVKEA